MGGYTGHWGASCYRVCLKWEGIQATGGHPVFEDVALVEFIYLVFTCMPSEGYHRQLGSLLLYWCYVFQALINSRVC